MSDMKDKERARQTRTERELAKIEAGSKPKSTPKPKTEKAKPKEKSGVGRDMAAENKARLMKDLDARIAAARAANNQDLVNKYEARKKALEAL